MNLKFAIVLINYKSWEDTLECLESLLKMDQKDFRVFIVDNSPNDESLRRIKEWSNGSLECNSSRFQELVLPFHKKPIKLTFFGEKDFYKSTPDSLDSIIWVIKAKENKGFAAGNNIILNHLSKKKNSFEKVWLLNNDTVVKPDTLSQIDNKTKNDSGLYLYGTPLMDYRKRNLIQAIGGKYNRFFGIPYHLGEYVELTESTGEVENYPIDYPIGASLILSIKTLKALGGMNEEYFLYFEELDWSIRLKRLGGKVKLINSFGVYHKHGNSTKQNLTQKNLTIELLSIRNRIVFAKKYNKPFVWSTKLGILLVTIPKRVIKGQFRFSLRILNLLFK